MSFIQTDGTIVRLEQNTTVHVHSTTNPACPLFRCQVKGLRTSSGKLIIGIDQHDVVSLPSGNILLIAREQYSPTELRQLGVPPESLALKRSAISFLIELTKKCQIVWEWHPMDHIGQSYSKQVPNWRPKRKLARMFDAATTLASLPFPAPEQSNSSAALTEVPVWPYISGLDYNAKEDQIVLSALDTNELLIIDHSTTAKEASTDRGGRSGFGGRLLFRYGYKTNPASGDLVIHGHAVHWAATDYLRAGTSPPPESYYQLLVFINGVWSDPSVGMKRQPASILQLTLPQPMRGGWYPVTAWGVAPDLLLPVLPSNSRFMGSVQRLASGNILVSTGDAQSVVMEVTDAGEVVWVQEWFAVYRALCVAPTLFGLGQTGEQHTVHAHEQLHTNAGSQQEV